ncbi:restriction endonuclease subunit S [Halalkalibaculum sp. DA3122]|uniref:restriction endonuclease subunit S n=1 Tax=unclassified Halalkalibaculum TaxID=2964617 RepID=UPI0037548A67
MLFKDFVQINPKVDLKKGKTYPYVGMADVNPSRGYVTNSETREYKNSRSKFKEGDTLFARITPCLENGKITRFKSDGIKKGFGSTEFFVFRAKEGVSDPNFVYYLSRSPLIRKTAEKSMAGASGRQRADITAVEEVEIDPPDLPIQQKIASILSGFDDLIENNTRRIEILEEMARRIYREWFVHFRYPGHQEDELVDSGTELGEIPEGWEVKKLEDFGEIVLGKTPSTKDSANYGDYMPFIKTPDMHDQIFIHETENVLSKKGVKTQENKTLPASSICVSCIGTAGVVALTSVPSQTNQQINSIVPENESYREYLYFTTKDLKPLMEKIGSTGATMTNVSKTKFKGLPALMPNQDLLDTFHYKVGPLFDQISTLQKQNIKLKETRNLLLPKLISGKIDIQRLKNQGLVL